MTTVTRVVAEEPVVIFSKTSCCVCSSIKTLINSFGVNPTVYELDEHPNGQQLLTELKALECKPSVPVVFIGQNLIGGANEIMSLHLKGKLAQLLVKSLASKNAAVIFTKSSCCMCHSIKALFYELGASPAIHEVDHDADLEWALRRLGCNPAVPAVFIGGKYVGSAKDIISLHVDGSLKQKLIEARAIWF
ncbi:thioredoxin superfamily protein [Tanacetum coccineum]